MGFNEREKNRKSHENNYANAGVVKDIINSDVHEKTPIVIAKPKEEIRSKRVQIITKPSIYDKAQKKCKQLGISFNESVNQFLENWVNE